METIVERPGALDVHKAQVTACVRVPAGEGRERVQEVAEFPTTVVGLLTLRDWLAAHRRTQVAMEATGVFWKPVWAILEDEFELLLVNARHVKQVPGRKTDVSDAAWLCQLAEAGLLRASFVPPKPIRALRELTRYRKTQIRERPREANRLHKALEDTGIKLDFVATDILGVSGRAMLDALVAGTTDPDVLAELARGRLRAKIPALREALEGRFDRLHALWIGAILRTSTSSTSRSQRWPKRSGSRSPLSSRPLSCSARSRGPTARRGDTDRRDRDRHERRSQRQAPRVAGPGMCPGNDQSAGQTTLRAHPQRHQMARLTLTKPRWPRSAPRTATSPRNTPASSPPRAPIALGAVKHSMLCAIWHMLTNGELYRDLGADYPRRRDPERTTKRLIAQLEALGHTVTIQQAQAA